MGRKRKKTWEEIPELERLQEENERLCTEVAYLKKLKELEGGTKPYSEKVRDNQRNSHKRISTRFTS